MSDDLTGVFDDLTPEDFSVVTTAFHSTDYPDQQYPEGQVGEAAFEVFVAECLRATQYAFTASDGQINPIGLLGNRHLRRSFAPDNDEIVGQYIARLAREARLMRATWFFISQIVPTAWFSSDTLHPSDSAEGAQEAVEQGETHHSNVYWYAERVEGTDSQRRHGIIQILESGKLGDLMEGIPEQRVSIYAPVLGTHQRR